MASFTIIPDGFITEPYVSTYGLSPKQGQNTLRHIDGDKYGMIVNISAEGKPNKAFYHEAENLDVITGEKQDGFPSQDTINFWLQELADNYEAAPNYT